MTKSGVLRGIQLITGVLAAIYGLKLLRDIRSAGYVTASSLLEHLPGGDEIEYCECADDECCEVCAAQLPADDEDFEIAPGDAETFIQIARNLGDLDEDGDPDGEE